MQHFETLAVHGGFSGDPVTHSVTPPLYQTNAYTFDSTAHAASLFELKSAGNIYSRLQNPTNDFLEKRVAALDGGIAALAFSSGHAAIFNSILNLCENGDEVVSSLNIYGGAVNMMGITLKRLGINVKFVNPDDVTNFEKAITDKTKLIFTELIGNPNANISDIEEIAKIAHKHDVPFMVDSTFNTPYLCRPIEYGADFVVHSATKFLSGHGQVMAGIVVDSGNFNFKGNKRFPLFNNPDDSYHGVVFADMEREAFITRLRTLIMRDVGACLAPFNALLVLNGIDTLHLRMERHSSNALAAATFLQTLPQVAKVNHPLLKDNKYYPLAKKYLPKGASGVFTFELSGGKAAGERFLDSLKLFQIVANVGDVRSQAIHPATTTHSQLSPSQLLDSGVTENTVRLSIGIEAIEDIKEDLLQAINSCNN